MRRHLAKACKRQALGGSGGVENGCMFPSGSLMIEWSTNRDPGQPPRSDRPHNRCREMQERVVRETRTLRVMWRELEPELRSLSETPRQFPTLPVPG
jgi:hypothetical protein